MISRTLWNISQKHGTYLIYKKIIQDLFDFRVGSNYTLDMKEKEKTPKQMGDRKQDELYFSSLPMFYQEQKQLKEELNKIVLNKENNGTTK